jgi:hypothetical protein
MSRRTVSPARCFARLLVLILALACQVVSGALLPAQAASASPSEALAAATVFCQAGHHPADHTPAPHHHATDSALLRATAAGALHYATQAGAPAALPPPALMRIGAVGLPPARAPPAGRMASAYPRGPPALV